jgi:hypothetical protein
VAGCNLITKKGIQYLQSKHVVVLEY